MRLVVADDHPVFRAGLMMILQLEDGVDVVGEASDGGEAVALVQQLRPDVAVLDLRMPEVDGVEATRRILAAQPRTAILILSVSDNDSAVTAALQAGARGYLLKDAAPAEIIAAIHAVAEGNTVLGGAIAARVVARAGSPTASSRELPELTAREREVLVLIAAGLGNAEITRRLVLSPKTVRNHVSNIFGKLQVTNRAQAIVKARESGLGDA